MPLFNWNEQLHRLLCNGHFLGFGGPAIDHSLPPIYPTATEAKKLFPTTKIEELVASDDDMEDKDEETIPNTTSDVITSSHTTTQDSGGSSYYHEASLSFLDVSVNLHDYCAGPILDADGAIDTSASDVSLIPDISQSSFVIQETVVKPDLQTELPL
ncbi:hypothetical protein ScPMuIL_013414 [Solemya velum]